MDEVPQRIYGVGFGDDFESGVTLWVSEATVEDDELRVLDCRSASQRFGVSEDRSVVLRSLTSFLSTIPASSVVGLDFPFGLPDELVPVDDWTTFLARFPDWFTSPEDLHRRCLMHAELVSGTRTTILRETDEPLGALSPYDQRLQARTFYGIRDVLRPLVTTETVAVLPMMQPAQSRPSLLETYPAGTLEQLELHIAGCEGDTDRADRRRSENLDGLEDHSVALAPEVRSRVLGNGDGNALDSVVAAFAAYRNTANDPPTSWLPEREVEGHVFV